MKKTILLFCAFLLALSAASQTKKPTIMILPSDNWCMQRYFMTTFDNQGTDMKVPNYPSSG